MDKRFFNLMMIFFLAFGLFITLTFFNKQISTFTRAKEELVPSSTSSLLFAWPLTASSVNNETVEVNVFVRNAENLPLSSRRVSLATTLGEIKENDLVTDKAGKVTFSLSSSSSGLADITAVVDGQVQLQQKVSIKFE